MNRKILAAGSIAAVAALALAGCSGGTDAGANTDPDAPVTLTLSGWSIDTTPEFQTLADAFTEDHPNVTVELKEYDPTEYNTLVTADLAAGSGPDIITQKEVKYVTTFQEGGQLLDVSDVKLPDGISGTDSYEVDGAAYAVPYRQDSWVLFYNKTLFEAAGVDQPDGSWTWDDYADAAEALTTDTAKGAYLHRWQSTVQGFANAQTGTSVLDGDFSDMTDYYDSALALQDAGSQVDFNTSTANQLTYQGEFGTQKAAMMLMGTWYTATLIAQQASGEANDFEWGIAPAPQLDEKTTGTDNTPVTFGDPTGFGINANIDSAKVDAAKQFLEFAASEKAAQALAEIGITPALTNDAVVDSYFGVEGAPTDDLSKFAWSTHEVLPENPTSNKTATIQGILADLHTAVMSGSSSVDDAVKTAEDRVKNEVG
ncbi:extracellular solute-binding protein [Microbacterium foliorum]|uniref:sn-glycerol-3-phosphate-binding periplasmic protein UgpB n=1 Tax=Microbacterium foliorum TaxID=104336 RepID=A0A0F0KSH2_9MICO|nr:extracellular solute-binding protein [Microbacterium foliorum]AXL13218.1 extracellular solute-binding protein [Microbacterium foliorum]KJL23080.1 sn-glycerol-3-phosphate-binding periplasmic protein UgpB precursor [Microbacterium foliorum]